MNTRCRGISLLSLRGQASQTRRRYESAEWEKDSAFYIHGKKKPWMHYLFSHETIERGKNECALDYMHTSACVYMVQKHTCTHKLQTPRLKKSLLSARWWTTQKQTFRCLYQRVFPWFYLEATKQHHLAVCLIARRLIIVGRWLLDQMLWLLSAGSSFNAFLSFSTTSMCCYSALPWSDGWTLAGNFGMIDKKQNSLQGQKKEGELIFHWFLTPRRLTVLFLALLQKCQTFSMFAWAVYRTHLLSFIFRSDKFIVSNGGLITIFSPKPSSYFFFPRIDMPSGV